MTSRPRFFVLSCVAAFLAAQFFAACTNEETDDGNGSSSSGAGGQAQVFPCGIDCSEIQTDQCHAGVCNEATGNCEIADAEEGTTCDDKQFCTVGDVCVMGECVGGFQNDCGMIPGPCEGVICNEGTKSCTTEGVAEGTPCQNSGNLCTVNAKCTSGQCVGNLKDCFFSPINDDCNTAACNPMTGDCEPTPTNEGLPCVDDTNLCSVNAVCVAGACSGGVPKVCGQLSGGCDIGTCDMATGNCVTMTIPENDPCDDLDPCTLGETCQTMNCTGGTPITACTAGDNCCPSTCNSGNDIDCSLTVLLLGDAAQTSDWDAYRNALMAGGVTFTEIDLMGSASNFPNGTALSAYNTVVWFDANTLEPDNAECQIMSDWLDTGGKNLFAVGQSFLWDVQNGAAGSGEEALYLKLGVTYLGDKAGGGIGTLIGVAADPVGGTFAGGSALTLFSSTEADYADNTVGPATHAGLYEAAGAGAAGEGKSGMAHRNSGTYKTVWLGVNFHELTDPGQRNELMTNVLNFFK
jgi:hypothetical protein